jgi:hypothetical protein
MLCLKSCYVSAVTGTLPPAPAVSPSPAAPAGLSRYGRGLKQLPASYASGGLAILQQLQQSIISRLQAIQPEIDATLATLKAPSPIQACFCFFAIHETE